MPNNTQTILFPVKGVNRALARSTQPDATAFDMLNVLPFDSTDRMRGGKRSGTRKVWSGGFDDSFLLLDQVTLAVDPFAGGGVTVFSDTFTYANGEINSVSSGKWSQFDDNTGTTSTTIVVASNKASVTGVHQNILFPTAAPTYDDTGGYSITMKVSMGDGCDFGLDVEGDEVVRYTVGPQYSLAIHNAAGSFDLSQQPRGSTFTEGVDYNGNLPITGPLTDTEFELKVTVSAGTGTSRTLIVTIDGVQKGMTMPLPAPGTTDNFVITMSGTTGKTVTVDDVVLATTGSTDPGSTRSTSIVAVASRDVIMGTITTQGTVVTGGSSVVAARSFPQGCYALGKYYIVDGTSILQLDLATRAMESYTATAGTAPTECQICCVFRDRLYLGRPKGQEQNFFASRVGNHHDWDYSQEDGAAAFEGNSATAGHIGGPLVAFIPLGDDQLGLMGDYECHVMRGDLADGGSIDLISDSIGIFGPQAWTKSPEGTVYFLGSSGLYKWAAGSNPLCVSDDKWNAFFKAIDRGRTLPVLRWDRDRKGLLIFLFHTGATIVTAPIHLWYDGRIRDQNTEGALFPIQFPVGHGPAAAVAYDGDAPDDRVMLLGGRDGFLRAIDDTEFSDDGDSIVTRVTLGPWMIGDAKNDGIVTRIDLTLGDPPTGATAADMDLTVTVKGGLTAFDVTDGTPKHVLARTYAGQQGRVTPLRGKVRGNYASIVLSETSANKTWSFEQLSLEIEPAGMTRR